MSHTRRGLIVRTTAWVYTYTGCRRRVAADNGRMRMNPGVWVRRHEVGACHRQRRAGGAGSATPAKSDAYG